MPRRLHQTLADYLVLAITPALIMFMVGSLVQFLMNVCYQGNYPERLSFTLTMFVFAAVLIARISMTEGAEKAILYGVALALVVALALDHYVEYGKNSRIRFTGLINWSLMAVIWWSAHKLTWDCTLMDDEEEESGEGLLQSAGLDRSGAGELLDKPEEPEAVTDRNATPTGWWQRFVEQRRRPHAHGVWVIYFSLAALPLFGIGQLALAGASLERRRHAFGLLCVYVASGLGLLLTTSFLGLRRYLRKRGLEMPLAMANSWVAVGSAIIVAVLVFAALLPRPNPEYAISELPFQVGSPDQRASQVSVGKEATPQERGGQGSTAQPKPDSQLGGDSHSEKAGLQTKTDAKSGEKGSADDSGESASQQKFEGKATDASKAESRPGETQNQGTPQPSRDGTSGSEGKNDSEPAGQSKLQQAERAGEQQSNRPPEHSQSAEQNQPPGQPAPNNPPPANLPAISALSIGGMLLFIVRWLFYGVICVLAIWGLLRYHREVADWLRELMNQLREFWESLFGGGQRRPRRELPDPFQAGLAQKSFSEFPDPFATGRAAHCATEELVKYSFEALEAWARDQGNARRDQETPFEFAGRVGVQGTTLSSDAQRLASLYCQIAYADGPLPPQNVEQIRQFWQSLGQTAVSV